MTKDDHTSEDVLTAGPVQEDGTQPYIRLTNNHIETGTLTIMQDGQAAPPDATLVSLKRRDDGRYDVQELHRTGPAKVSSDAFRSGWDRIFGNKTVGQA